MKHKPFAFLMGITVSVCGCGHHSEYGISYNNTSDVKICVNAATNGAQISPGFLGGGGKEGQLGATLFPVQIQGNKIHLKVMAMGKDGQYDEKWYDTDVAIPDAVIEEAENGSRYVQVVIRGNGDVVVKAAQK